MRTLLHEQSMIRTVTKEEVKSREIVIKNKFNDLIYALKSRVYKTLVDYHKEYKNAMMTFDDEEEVSSDDEVDFQTMRGNLSSYVFKV